MDMMNTTRRSVLGIAGAGTLAALTPAASGTMRPSEPGAIRPELAAAEARFRQADLISARYDSLVFTAAHRRQECAAAAVPHVTTAYTAMSGERVLTTSERQDIAIAKGLASILRDKPEAERREWQRRDGIREARRFVAAHHRRERAIARLPETVALKAAARRSDELSARAGELEEAFYAVPSASLADLQYKLRLLDERGGLDAFHFRTFILPDAAALARAEGH